MASVFKLRALLCLCLSALLSGCGTADYYSPRAQIMNAETSKAKSNQILLNILRAAYREPLQFTDTSTITGTASVGASLSSSLPFAGNRGTGAQLFSLSPGATVSEGPAFNIANLNTQEFYQGIQTPIDLSPIASYKASGTDFGNLLSLVSSDIDLTSEKKRVFIHNTFRKRGSYAFYRSVLNDLIRNGLSIEVTDSQKTIGPVLTAEQAGDPAFLAGLARAYGQTQSAGAIPDLKGVAGKDGKQSKTLFNFAKTDKRPRFCFLGSTIKEYQNVDVDVIRRSVKGDAKTITLAYSPGNDVSFFKDTVAPGSTCGVKASSADDAHPSTYKLTERIDIHTRSVEQIIRFLGDMVRAELGLENGERADFPVGAVDGGSVRLFRIQEGSPSEGDIFATYHGRSFFIRPDATGADDSGEVVQLLAELIALQSSAKSYPTPNVISVAAP